MGSAWESRFAELVRRLTGARESTALEVLPDLMPVLDVLSPLPEVAIHRDEDLFSVALSRTAAAGNLPTISVCCTNPGLVSIVEGLVLTASGGPANRIIAELTTYAAAGSPASAGTAAQEVLDRRRKLQVAEPQTFIAQADQVGAIPGIECFDLVLPADVALYLPFKCVLLGAVPGTAAAPTGTCLRIQSLTVAGTLRVTAWGRERVPSTFDERQP